MTDRHLTLVPPLRAERSAAELFHALIQKYPDDRAVPTWRQLAALAERLEEPR